MTKWKVFKNPGVGSIRTFELDGKCCFAERILRKHLDT